MAFVSSVDMGRTRPQTIALKLLDIWSNRAITGPWVVPFWMSQTGLLGNES